MARVNRTTGFFLILGVAVLIVSVTGVNMIMQNSASSAASKSPEDDRTPVVLDVVCTGKVDVPAGLEMPVPGAPGRVVELCVHEGEDVKLAANERKAAQNQLERKKDLAGSQWSSAAKILQQTQDLKKAGAAKDIDLTMAIAKEDEARRLYDSACKALDDFKANDPIPGKTKQVERNIQTAEDNLRAAEKMV